MRKFVFALSALAAIGLAAPVFTAPAQAQDTKIVVKKHRPVHKKIVIKKHEPATKVVIRKHHHHHHMHGKVVIKEHS